MSIKGFKGFDKDLKCRDFQYEVGKTYETDSKPVKCTKNGFHFCENPLDIFSYYPLVNSRFCEVVGEGDVDKRTTTTDSKVAVSKIHIRKELSISGFVEACIDFLTSKALKVFSTPAPCNDSVMVNDKQRVSINHRGYFGAAVNIGDTSLAINECGSSIASNTGSHSAAVTTGDDSISANTGRYSVASSSGGYGIAANTAYQSIAENTARRGVAVSTGSFSVANAAGEAGVATNVGNTSIASATGQDSVAVSLGNECMAKGAIGCWLVLADWGFDAELGKTRRTDVKCVKVDGEIIKANTLYKLANGEFVEA